MLPRIYVLPHSHDVADLFEPSVQAIIDGFKQQRRVALTPVNVSDLVFLTDKEVTTW
jgi:hypothetical protein